MNDKTRLNNQFSLHQYNENSEQEDYEQKKVKSLSNHIISKERKYSLVPDMISGWRPLLSQFQFFKKINLKFNSPHDDYLNNLIKNNDSSLVYIGPRPSNNEILQRLLNKNTYDFHKNNKNCLQFSSNFQCGNIDFVQQKPQNKYQLWMRCDTNSQHTQWFYFKVKTNYQIILCNKQYQVKNTTGVQKVNFTINNFYKNKSIYQQGMKPYIKSKKSNKGWEQTGEDVKYQKEQLNESELFSLSFNYTFLYENDQVSFAYCIPYSYTKLKKYLSKIQSKYPQIMIQSNLCNTFSNIECPLLTITNQNSKFNKYTVLISARIHPGETNSSFVMQGLIDFLLSEEARSLRDYVSFKLVPMLNPDGVIIGNYRTGLQGYDYNREYKQTQNEYPTILSLMNLAKMLKEKENLIIYMDLHGHSTKRNSFAYGPKFAQQCYYECRVLPKLISQFTEMFRFHQCRFNDEKGKITTGRKYIEQLCDIISCFTIETSFGVYVNRNNQTVHFDKQSFFFLGKSIGRALDQFIQIKEKQNEVKKLVKLDLKQNKIKLVKLNNQRPKFKKISELRTDKNFYSKQSQTNNYYQSILELQEIGYQNESESDDEHSGSEKENIQDSKQLFQQKPQNIIQKAQNSIQQPQINSERMRKSFEISNPKPAIQTKYVPKIFLPRENGKTKVLKSVSNAELKADQQVKVLKQPLKVRNMSIYEQPLKSPTLIVNADLQKKDKISKSTVYQKLFIPPLKNSSENEQNKHLQIIDFQKTFLAQYKDNFCKIKFY